MGNFAALGSAGQALAHGMIAVRVKSKWFGQTQILGSIRFDLASGETIALIGPSGVGKSTLLRIIAGIDIQFEGQVERPDTLAMVFQEPNLLPWRSALQNISLCHRDVDERAARAMLERVGLAHCEAMFPNQLSLGQQRRLSLARAFTGRPAFLVMDEPFVSLDAKNAKAMLDLVIALMAEVKPATLFVTHDTKEVQRLATRAFELQGNPATLLEVTL